ncbi:MAG: spore coat associated protein CotJA [Caldicoprobacterales bacterium]|jgi:hypothetical protein|nr:spore coat associated protein CotJA [Clostridiales bacterium]
MYFSYKPQNRYDKPIQPPVQQNFMLARAYVPDQQYSKTFSPEEALHQGTLFPELVNPYKKMDRERLL